MTKFSGYFTTSITALIGLSNEVSILQSAFFRITNTKSSGGALLCTDRDKFTCIDCRFVACKTNSRGGAIYTNDNNESTIEKVCSMQCFALIKTQSIYVGETVSSADLITTFQCTTSLDFIESPENEKVNGAVYFDGDKGTISGMNSTHSYVSSYSGVDFFAREGELDFSIFAHNVGTRQGVISLAAPSGSTKTKTMYNCCIVSNSLIDYILIVTATTCTIENLVCYGNEASAAFIAPISVAVSFVNSVFDFQAENIPAGKAFTLNSCVFGSTGATPDYRLSKCHGISRDFTLPYHKTAVFAHVLHAFLLIN